MIFLRRKTTYEVVWAFTETEKAVSIMGIIEMM
jgi:hypothetical protein